MKKTTTLDCVEMKNQIQARIAKENDGLTDEEIRIRTERELDTSDHPVAVWWRRVHDAKRTQLDKPE